MGVFKAGRVVLVPFHELISGQVGTLNVVTLGKLIDEIVAYLIPRN